MYCIPLYVFIDGVCVLVCVCMVLRRYERRSIHVYCLFVLFFLTLLV